MTIAENVAQAELGIDRERGKKCLSLAGLEQKITQLPKEIDTHLGQVYEDGIRLPGGEAQRLMLARALYKSAPVFLCDTPERRPQERERVFLCTSFCQHSILPERFMTDGV